MHAQTKLLPCNLHKTSAQLHCVHVSENVYRSTKHVVEVVKINYIRELLSLKFLVDKSTVERIYKRAEIALKAGKFNKLRIIMLIMHICTPISSLVPHDCEIFHENSE